MVVNVTNPRKIAIQLCHGWRWPCLTSQRAPSQPLTPPVPPLTRDCAHVLDPQALSHISSARLCTEVKKRAHAQAQASRSMRRKYYCGSWGAGACGCGCGCGCGSWTLRRTRIWTKEETPRHQAWRSRIWTKKEVGRHRACFFLRGRCACVCGWLRRVHVWKCTCCHGYMTASTNRFGTACFAPLVGAFGQIIVLPRHAG
jgi:hypothetical protein